MRKDENNMIVLNVTYTIKPGKREEFYIKVKESGIVEQSRLEEGNLKYEYYIPIESDNEILLIEIWKDLAAQNTHKELDHFNKLQKIKEDYVTDVKFEKYSPCL